MLIWVDQDMAWLAPHEGRPGRLPVFSDAAIQFCLSVKVLFKLPLRQTAGMVASLLRLAGLNWSVPDFSTLCRKQKTLAVQIPYRRAEGPLNLLVDSTGIKFLGDGDSPILPELLGQIPEDEQIGTVTADGACDTRRCHAAITERQAVPVIPIRKNGRPWKEDCPAARARNETLRATKYYGRAFWKHWTRYQERSRVEAKMRGIKAFGERIAARDPDRQTAEIHIRVALKNRFNALGTADIVRVV